MYFIYLFIYLCIYLFIYFLVVVRVTDPHGSSHGPITNKDHVYTMGMPVYASIVNCDVTSMCDVTY